VTCRCRQRGNAAHERTADPEYVNVHGFSFAPLAVPV
jgi:hypothetical protein